ncbi:hypothetical protein A3K86_15970 [Photobacterium jeanii]|uniref:Uncharacterized protein n=1 Tax=Photobacterium jeanii TaxID=858640 RepID=A0A178K7V8_9GAMM|nr:hypothetical protein [Photobacterium jeanii]OAN13156.1 hypothetical protein A3K86_15970 [Photobacterium jeanii]PST89308.1 hypothetical protein C9I91_14415 [Photobacterium jeanii]
MDSSDHDGIKRDISVTVTDIFDSFEEENNRLPTMEEFRTIFSHKAEQYIGPMDELSVEGIHHTTDKHQLREQKLWRAVNELESEQRCLRSESDYS